jgi:hypothetical protein
MQSNAKQSNAKQCKARQCEAMQSNAKQSNAKTKPPHKATSFLYHGIFQAMSALNSAAKFAWDSAAKPAYTKREFHP